jgi:hypothetical protein
MGQHQIFLLRKTCLSGENDPFVRMIGPLRKSGMSLMDPTESNAEHISSPGRVIGLSKAVVLASRALIGALPSLPV